MTSHSPIICTTVCPRMFFSEVLLVPKSGCHPSIGRCRKSDNQPGKFSQIWLWTRYEVQKFNHPLATYWSFIKFSIEILELKTSKSLEFCFANFIFVEIFPIEKRLVAFKWYSGLFNKILRPGIFFSVWNLSLFRKCFQNKEYFVTIFLFFEKKS